MNEFKNRTTFIPAQTSNEPYTNVLNKVLEDERLTLLAIGIYTYILKFKNYFYDGKRYVIVKGVIQRKSGFGYDTFTKHWNILVKCGYINAKQIKSGWEYEFIENPVLNSSNDNRVSPPTIGILTNSKKTNSKNAILETKYNKKQILSESLETLDSRAQVQEPDFSKTDTIQLADANCSISDQAAIAADILTYRNNSISPVLKFDFDTLDESNDSLCDLSNFIDESDFDIGILNNVIIHKKPKVLENPLF
jgi:hypothetical protein